MASTAEVSSPSESKQQAGVSSSPADFAPDAKPEPTWNLRSPDRNENSDDHKATMQENKASLHSDIQPEATADGSAEHGPVTLLLTVNEEDPKEEHPDKDEDGRTFEPFPYYEGWRGLAHYRTESRRKVVKKKPEDRTASDLYVLEESVKNVKLISDLPLAKRLEVCKILGYEVWDEGQHVYEQGQMGTKFYIVFTGLVRASICEEGVQEPRTTVVLPGDGFGELALLSDDQIINLQAGKSPGENRVQYRLFTTELLTISRKDYDKILQIEKTPEMKARVKFLREVEAFQKVSKQSLQRLANVLHARTYAKNKVITFQGDEAFEMFFVKSGECRIIMEATAARKPVLKIPRVSTFLYMHRPTVHHKCKVEVLLREREYGRPSLVSKASQRSTTKMSIPVGLADELLENPDLIHELAMGHKRAREAARSSSPSRSTSRLGNALRPSRSKSASKRPDSAPSSFRLSASGRPIGDDPPHEHKKLSRTPSSPRNSPEREKSSVQNTGRVSQPPKLSGGQKKAKTSTTRSEDQAYTVPKRRQSTYTFAQKYTLDTFLSEVEAKERMIAREIDFSEKDHALWHMGMTQGVMRTGFSEDVMYYKNKFQRWARGVLNRERVLMGFNIYDDKVDSPSFTKGAPLDHIMRLEQVSGPQSKGRKVEKDAMILDIGALQAGSYFGEKGLLQKSRRAVSIVTICPVEVLVLNIWDFHRHCDRDIINALSSHDYKKEEQIYKEYLKNCRWERFKKKCLDEVLLQLNYRREERLGARGMRYIPKANVSNPLAPPPAEWK